jgi:hypothetical protein
MRLEVHPQHFILPVCGAEKICAKLRIGQ